jgi:hypothetical protein
MADEHDSWLEALGVDVGDSLGNLAHRASGAVKGFADAGAGAVKKFADAGAGAVKTFADVGAGAVKTLAPNAPAPVKAFVDTGAGAVKTFADAGAGTVKNLADTGAGTVKTVADTGEGAVETVASGVSAMAILQHAKGGDALAQKRWSAMMSDKKFRDAIDKGAITSLNQINPLYGILLKEIGGVETLKELMKLDWADEWNKTALAIGKETGKQFDAGVKYVKDTASGARQLAGMHGDEVIGTAKEIGREVAESKIVKESRQLVAGYSTEEALGQLKQLRGAIGEAHDKVTDRIADAINDPAGAAKSFGEAVTTGVDDAKTAVAGLLKSFWRSDPEEVREKLAVVPVEAGKQIILTATGEGAMAVAGKLDKVIEARRVAQKMEAGAEALEAVVGEGRPLAPRVPGEAPKKAPNVREPAPKAPGTGEAPSGTPAKPQPTPDPAAPGRTRGVASTEPPATQTSAVGAKSVTHDTGLKPSGNTMTTGTEGGPRPQTTTGDPAGVGGRVPGEGSQRVREPAMAGAPKSPGEASAHAGEGPGGGKGGRGGGKGGGEAGGGSEAGGGGGKEPSHVKGSSPSPEDPKEKMRRLIKEAEEAVPKGEPPESGQPKPSRPKEGPPKLLTPAELEEAAAKSITSIPVGKGAAYVYDPLNDQIAVGNMHEPCAKLLNAHTRRDTVVEGFLRRVADKEFKILNHDLSDAKAGGKILKVIAKLRKLGFTVK